jgi:hypothetical protein
MTREITEFGTEILRWRWSIYLIRQCQNINPLKTKLKLLYHHHHHHHHVHTGDLGVLPVPYALFI